MHVLQKQREKRKEPRFAVNMQLNIHPDQPGSKPTLSATADDISLHGLGTWTEEQLSPGQEVLVKYTHAQSGREVIRSGRIRWQESGLKKSRVGIELHQKNICTLNLEQASKCSLIPAEPLAPHFSLQGKVPPSSVRADLFQFEIFWGLLFKTFQDPLQKNLVYISSNINLGRTHLENEMHKVMKNEILHDFSSKLTYALSFLEKANSRILKLANLFRMMQEENICMGRSCMENLPGDIDMNQQLGKRFDSFQEKIDSLMISNGKKMRLYQDHTSMRTGTIWRINYGLDFLLLYCYQFLLLEHANQLNIRIREAQGTIYLEIRHDGSGILAGDNKEVTLNNTCISKNSIHPRDKTHILWFYHILGFFRELDATIRIKSDPGNNLVVLKV